MTRRRILTFIAIVLVAYALGWAVLVAPHLNGAP